MMVCGAEFLAIGGIKGVALFHLAPAEEILHCSRETAVAMEEDVEQDLV